MNYRATPHSTTGKSPAKLLFGRKMNIMLPQVQISPAHSQDLIGTDFMAKSKMKTYAGKRTHAKSHSIKIDDTVLLKVKWEGTLMLPCKPISYKVIAVKAFIIAAKQENSDNTVTRNSLFFKLIDPINSHRSS